MGDRVGKMVDGEWQPPEAGFGAVDAAPQPSGVRIKDANELEETSGVRCRTQQQPLQLSALSRF